ncbi:MAG: 23S rRNA (guanosine(2251)-2'-O)-methyltransferase RlmB, partial [Clostridia bacterium]|nr:23S rRNA (guanosine(2251)-2'-O)-methyltransferase RlmB [Deltaproteobacteria bacterium]
MSRIDAIYGRHPVLEALRSGSREIERVLIADGTKADDVALAAEDLGIRVERSSRGKLDGIIGGAQHQGIV